MRYQLKVGAVWEYGQRKDAAGNPHQEDALFPLPDRMTDSDRLFVLCDGMGGHDAGEVASATVCEAMSRSVLAAQPEPEGDFTDGMFRQALSDAFDALDEKDTGAEKKMGTTMTFLKLHSRGATIAHMGDSRVYHIRPGKTADETCILFQTKDHSLVNFLIDTGELTEEEARHSRQKNVIIRAMQPNMEHRPKADIYHTEDIRPGDYFYLCSDGMLENMEDRQIRYHFSEAAGSDEEKLGSLVKATQENRDNHTAIIVHVMEVLEPAEEKAVEPERTVAAPEALIGEVHDDEDIRTEAGRPARRGLSKRRIGWLALIVALIAIMLAIVYCIPAAPNKSRKEPPGREKVGSPDKEAAPQTGVGETGGVSSGQPSKPDVSVGQEHAAPVPAAKEDVVLSDEERLMRLRMERPEHWDIQ